MIFIISAVWGIISYAIGSAATRVFEADIIGWIAGILIFSVGFIIIFVTGLVSSISSEERE